MLPIVAAMIALGHCRGGSGLRRVGCQRLTPVVDIGSPAIADAGATVTRDTRRDASNS